MIYKINKIMNYSKIKRILKCMPSYLDNKFQVGKVYINYRNIYEPRFRIVKRTPKTLTIIVTNPVWGITDEVSVQMFKVKIRYPWGDAREACRVPRYKGQKVDYPGLCHNIDATMRSIWDGGLLAEAGGV